MIDSNDGSHRYGGGYNGIREDISAESRVRTKFRPERIILRCPIFSKHKINETRVINTVFLGNGYQ